VLVPKLQKFTNLSYKDIPISLARSTAFSTLLASSKAS
jgi:hypothetical protein